MIRNINKIDLGTIDLAITADEMTLDKLSKVNITEDARQAWEYEINADIKRLQEIRTGYLDGRTEARHARDSFIMMMNVSLLAKFLSIVERMKNGNEAHTDADTPDTV